MMTKDHLLVVAGAQGLITNCRLMDRWMLLYLLKVRNVVGRAKYCMIFYDKQY